eukprot:scaffold38148_cov35-Prasinocladus_malaysianus.AAC.3
MDHSTMHKSANKSRIANGPASTGMATTGHPPLPLWRYTCCASLATAFVHHSGPVGCDGCQRARHSSSSTCMPFK